MPLGISGESEDEDEDEEEEALERSNGRVTPLTHNNNICESCNRVRLT